MEGEIWRVGYMGHLGDTEIDDEEHYRDLDIFGTTLHLHLSIRYLTVDNEGTVNG